MGLLPVGLQVEDRSRDSDLCFRDVKEIPVSDKQKIEDMISQNEQASIALEPELTGLVDVQRFFTRTDLEFAQLFQKLAPGALDGGNRENLSRWLKEIRKRSHRST